MHRGYPTARSSVTSPAGWVSRMRTWSDGGVGSNVSSIGDKVQKGRRMKLPLRPLVGVRVILSLKSCRGGGAR